MFYLLSLMISLTLEASNEQKLHEHLRGGGGSIEPPPSNFDGIHPIDMIFGTYKKLSLYFQLSETTWCLIGSMP